ncbi:MAG TPA: hypothetical protein VLJ68_03020 [Chitinophagaceae bacterium]|nr:hypothetical protein [Chitinophagaceae bacterium]
MQFIKTLVRLFLFLFPLASISQTTFLPQGDKAAVLVERMEIKAGKDSALNFSKTKPFSRQQLVMDVTRYVGKIGQQNLTKVDLHNLQSLYANNLEWVPEEMRGMYKSRKPLTKSFYTTAANLFEVHNKDFDLAISPVFQYILSKEQNNDQHLFLNTRGLNVRGRIAKKIGFYAYLTDNQERDPAYVQQWVNDRMAVPGEGLYKQFKSTGYDYFDARGYITFSVTPFIDVAFGYDKHFIGNGYRSMFLSDFGNNAVFLKLNTRIWKVNYQNLFLELHSPDRGASNVLIPKKYAVMHHLDIDLTKWLNIGVFEGIVFGRRDHFEFGYLNPIIFYRSIELQNGSFDNSVAGLDLKANVAKKFQFYGQLLLDEFLLSEIKKNRGWWANKWGIQIGAKYIDAFGIKNLDLQIEHNRVRPFTYSHTDSVANYTHYNQPMAHPLMANFKEVIAIARYQPAPKWMLVAKIIAYEQGRDAGSESFGSNIFLPNQPPYRLHDFGYNIGSGWKTDVLFASFLLSYELRENLFLEAYGLYRKLETKTAPIMSENTTVISFGIRWNMHRREFEF